MTSTILLAVFAVGFTGGLLVLLPKMARPTVPFGVRVPDTHTDAPVIRQATGQYYRGVTVTVLVVMTATVAGATVLPLEVVLTVAPFVLLAAWFVPFLAARRRVLDAKQTEGWFVDVRQTAVADTSMRTSPPPYPWAWAAPAILIVLVTFAIGIGVYPSLPDQIATHFGPRGPDQFSDTTVWTAFGLPFIQAGLTVLLLGLVPVALRGKADLSASSPEVSADQYRRYSEMMARMVLLLAAGMNLTFGFVALIVWEVLPAAPGWIIGAMAPTLLATVVLVGAAIRAGQSGHRLTPEVGQDSGTRQGVADRDDDSRWIGGLVYVNSDDPALWVPRRFGGIGWTMNFGRPLAWVLTVVLIGAPVVVAVWAAVSVG